MIKVSNLVKSFDGLRALDGMNVNVPRGSVYGLIGPNGAGKSTLIRHLAGILIQDSGEVLIDNEPVFENNRIKEKIAYIPDDVFYYRRASVDDMARFYASVYPSFSMERFNELREDFGSDRNRPIKKLSKGMQKQAAFRLALSQNPSLLILDEPVDGLDPVMRRTVWRIILRDVAERGTTVLISSHNLRELEDVCDRVGIVNGGKMLLERSLNELQENIVKLQFVLPEGTGIPCDLDIVHASNTGRLNNLIVRGSREDICGRIGALNPVFLEVIPLSLEEIFIYEIGGAGDEEMRNIIL